jgi:hypothetical protein
MSHTCGMIEEGFTAPSIAASPSFGKILRQIMGTF